MSSEHWHRSSVWATVVACALALAGCLPGYEDSSGDGGAEAASDALTDTSIPDVTTESVGHEAGEAGKGGGVEGGKPEGGEGGEAGACVPGGTCVVSECQGGQFVCTPAGVKQCESTGGINDGMSCGTTPGSVCHKGACVACAAGTDCTPMNSCTKMQNDCSTGIAVCVDAGPANNGTSCGMNLFCDLGACKACTAGDPCTPSPPDNPCHAGLVVCSTGQASCQDQGTPAMDGHNCGTNMVCSGGQCMPCTANTTCHPNGDPCKTGVTSCSTGAQTCMPTGNSTDGTPCTGTNKCDQSYACQAGVCTGSSPVACTAMDACHVAGTCAPATGLCSNPVGNNGASCGSNLACENGGCSTQLTVTAIAVKATQGIGLTVNVANVTDTVTGETVTASINWGDGTAASAGTVSGGGGAFMVSGSHSYAQGATATSGTVTITAANGNQASAFFNVTLGKVTITEYTNATMNGPWGIVLGPDQNMWFTQLSYVGKITPTGTITQYSPPSETGGNYLNTDITFGSDGIWFSESKLGSIASVTTSGVINEYLSGYHGPTGITTGPDGNIWFIDKNPTTTYYVIRAIVPPTTPSYDFTTYTLSGASGVIASGPDGALWFTQPNAIGRITTAGTLSTPYPLSANSGPSGIVAGPDGAMWVTEYSAGKIARITTAGQVTNEYPIPTAASQPTGICVGPDNQLWFTEQGSNQIGRITTQGVISEFPVPTPASLPERCATGSDGALWFTENAGNKIGKLVLP